MRKRRKSHLGQRLSARTWALAADEAGMSTVEYAIGTSSVSASVNSVVVGAVTDHLDTDLIPARPMSRFDALITAHPDPTYTGS